MKKILTLFLAFSLMANIFAQTGSTDATFNTIDSGNGNGDGSSGTVNLTKKLASGKILLAGGFTTYNGIPVGRIAVVNLDGSLDTSFNTAGLGANNTINAASVLPNGKILIAGNFTSYNGIAVNKFIRLNSDGSLDTTFNPSGAGANGNVGAIAIQQDGKILLGGQFTTYNDNDAYRLVRINADGSWDSSYDTSVGISGASGTSVSNIVLDATDNAYIIGTFTMFNGVAVNPNNPTMNANMVRLTLAGTRDPGFVLNAFNTSALGVSGLFIENSGKLVVTGFFTTYNSVEAKNIMRLQTDATLDTTFAPISGPNQPISRIVQISDQFLMMGNFTSYDGVTVGRIVRINPNGTLDETFNNGNIGANGNIMNIMIDTADSYYLSGSFSKYNGRNESGFTHIDSNGNLDPNFNVGTGFDSGITSMSIQDDNRIVVAGTFSTYNQVTAKGIVRMNKDGVLDTGFNTGLGFNAGGSPASIAKQTDGKIIAGGTFTSYNGIPSVNLARINADGSLDATFTTNLGTSFNNSVNSVLYRTDGKIIVSGSFTSFNGTTVGRVAMLNEDGTLNTSFTTNNGTGSNQVIYASALQSDGKIIIAGNIANFNATASIKIARLNADGTLDNTFSTNIGTGPNFLITALAVQPDGKIIIGGNFTTIKGSAAVRVARLNSDGTVDTTFSSGTGPNQAVMAIAIDGNGKIVIGGNFDTYAGTNSSRIARLNTDGSLDADFVVGNGANGNVAALAMTSDNKILAGGLFTNYNGVGKNRFTRILNSNTPLHVSQVVKDEIIVYPNPFASEIHIKGTKEVHDVLVYDLSGKQVSAQKNKNLNLSNLPKGTYLMQVIWKDHTISTKKIIKK